MFIFFRRINEVLCSVGINTIVSRLKRVCVPVEGVTRFNIKAFTGLLFRILVDLLSGVLLLFYGLLVGPLSFLRGTVVFERVGNYLLILLPAGLFLPFIRALIDWRLGNFDCAIAHLEGVLTSLEDSWQEESNQQPRRESVLMDVYSLLARMCMHSGHIDDAMLLVIRANKVLHVKKLNGLVGLDVKTAHMVRAGIAAGKLLDGGGLATFLVRTSTTEQKPPGTTKGRRGHADGSEPEASEKKPVAEAKIIPFPKYNPLS